MVIPNFYIFVFILCTSDLIIGYTFNPYLHNYPHPKKCKILRDDVCYFTFIQFTINNKIALNMQQNTIIVLFYF
jgi:hypothetical protein